MTESSVGLRKPPYRDYGDYRDAAQEPQRNGGGGAPRLRLTAKALKVTAVLDPAALVDVDVPPGSPPVDFVIVIGAGAGGRKVTGRFNAKTLRKAVATVNEHGVDQVAAIVQGRLAAGDALEDAGLAVQPKGAPRP